jgi:uncharacterized protein YbaP (TraB family)
VKLTLQLSILLLAALAFGCDKQPSAQDDEPPEWVKEANERSQAQREMKDKKSTAPAPTRPATGAKVVKAQLIERPLLWRVKGENGPVYLFGTIHGGIPGLEWDAFPAEAHEAIDSSELVVLEADVDDFDPKAIGQLSMLPKDKSLKKILGEEHFKTLVAASGQPAMMLDLLRPWAAYAELSRVMVGEGRPVDDMIKVEARARKKEIVYLESVTEQLEIMESAVNAELVRQMLAELDKQKRLLDQMVDAYKQGDIDALAAVAFEPSEVERHPELYDKLFTTRNRAWIPQIETYIERGNTFVAVGAGHLAGDNSVIKMLEDKGHQVERVAVSEKTAATKKASQEATPNDAK